MMKNITMKDYRAYDMALKVAMISECRYKLGAVITASGNRILSLAVNVLKTHTDHKKWPNHVISVHAEHNAIRNARHKDIDLRNSTIYIARYGGNKISKPCSMCAEYIYLAGIKYIVYFNGSELIKVKV